MCLVDRRLINQTTVTKISLFIGNPTELNFEDVWQNRANHHFHTGIGECGAHISLRQCQDGLSILYLSL